MRDIVIMIIFLALTFSIWLQGERDELINAKLDLLLRGLMQEREITPMIGENNDYQIRYRRIQNY